MIVFKNTKHSERLLFGHRYSGGWHLLTLGFVGLLWRRR
jgi:hypothetical protein